MCLDDAARRAASFFIGNAYQAQMPGFADDLGHGDPGVSYSMLLAADAAGALIAGLALEARGLLTPTPRTAIVLAMLWCLRWSLRGGRHLPAGARAAVRRRLLRTVVQHDGADPGAAPCAADIRGRVIGLFNMAAWACEPSAASPSVCSAAAIGIHRSLALSAVALLVLSVRPLSPRRQQWQVADPPLKDRR